MDLGGFGWFYEVLVGFSGCLKWLYKVFGDSLRVLVGSMVV